MATQLEIYNEALRLIGEHSIASTAVDEEPRYVLDDAYARVIVYCLSQGWWRFAFFTSSVSPSSSSSYPGYSQAFAKPSNWLRTHSVGVIAGTQFFPVDWFEAGSSIAVKYASSVAIRFVKGSSTEKDPANWPEVFAKYVAAYLAFECCERITSSRTGKSDVVKVMEERLATARATESYPPPLTLPEHAVERVTRKLLEEGFWRFSIKSATPSTTTGASAGYSAVFTLPADWMRTYEAYVVGAGSRLVVIDRFEEGGKISAQHASIRLRYVSSSFVDPSTWTQAFYQAVETALGLESAKAEGAAPDKVEAMRVQLGKILDEQLGKERLPRPLLLEPGAVDRVVHSQLESGLWKFAIKTVALTAGVDTPSAGYGYAFDKPTDWQRTVRVFRLIGSGLTACEEEIDFRDESNDLHANYSPIQLRYILASAYAPTSWTELFTAAFEAGLRYESARAEQMREGEVAARYKTWRELLGQAAMKDGLNERPKVYRTGLFNAARRRPGGFVNREQGY